MSEPRGTRAESDPPTVAEATPDTPGWSASLGDVVPARSRHGGRRSAVAVGGDTVAVGTADGAVQAFDRETGDRRWRADDESADTAVVTLAALDGGATLLAGERGPAGAVRCYDAATGEQRWRYSTAADVGPPERASRFFRPFVVDVERDGDGGCFVAARRYERDGDDRAFTSVVCRFDATGAVTWRYETDASPIALDTARDGTGRVAVAYNRCPGDHRQGLVVLDGETGAVRYAWDPGGDGDRRVGDVSLVADGACVASHADYRGYRLRDGGAVAWRADLARPTTVGEETLYAYPNHVHAVSDGAVFVTGNTYAVGSRETEDSHPNDHTALGHGPDGERRWTADVGGFANGVAADGDRLAVPGAQDFRTRDAAAHGLRLFGVVDGPRRTVSTEGIVTAAAVDGRTVAAVEEPVSYHDEDRERGEYRVFVV